MCSTEIPSGKGRVSTNTRRRAETLFTKTCVGWIWIFCFISCVTLCPAEALEYNDNRVSLYSGQMGKCAVTGRRLRKEEIHCHHKTPRQLGGDDSYGNLQIIHIDVHRLIHAKDEKEIQRLMKSLQLTEFQIERVNLLRNRCNLFPILKN